MGSISQKAPLNNNKASTARDSTKCMLYVHFFEMSLVEDVGFVSS